MKSNGDLIARCIDASFQTAFRVKGRESKSDERDDCYIFPASIKDSQGRGLRSFTADERNGALRIYRLERDTTR